MAQNAVSRFYQSRVAFFVMGKLLERIATEFRENSCVQLTEMVNELEGYMGKLSEEQVWQPGGEHENAVGNLILHLCRNMRHWVLRGIKDDGDERTRAAEFANQGGQSGKVLMDQFRAVTTEVMQEIRELPGDRLLDWTKPQPGRSGKTILASISEGVEDARWHVSEAILRVSSKR
jgi:hypothetical protein